MSGPRERFVMRAEGDRRQRASTSLAFAAFGFIFLAIAGAVWKINDFGAVPSELLYPFAAFFAFLLFALGAGLYPRIRPRHYVSVDTAAGTATFVQDGAVTRKVPLTEVGPLRHAVDERSVRSGKSYRTAVFHVARSAPFPEFLLFESEDEVKTRRVLESRAKAWGVPYVKPSGETRNPEELDVPLFQRLGADEKARMALPQKPGSKLAVTWREGGWEITTSYRPPPDRVKLVLMFAGPLVLLVWLFREPLLAALRAGSPMASRLAAGGVVLLSLVPGLVVAGKAWLRSHRPPSIRISAEGVRFRGRSLPLKAIEEVERVRGAACRLVSDRRIVTIDADLCEPSEYEWLHHELRRLVIEAGQQSPVL